MKKTMRNTSSVTCHRVSSPELKQGTAAKTAMPLKLQEFTGLNKKRSPNRKMFPVGPGISAGS